MKLFKNELFLFDCTNNEPFYKMFNMTIFQVYVALTPFHDC